MKTIIAQSKSNKAMMILNVDKIIYVLKKEEQENNVYYIRFDGMDKALEVIIKPTDIPDELKMDFGLLNF